MDCKGEVLVVDDDRDLLDLISLALAHAGYKVSCAGDGAEAVAMARAGGFDLIVLDMMMPRMDGVSALAEIKKTAPGLEVIMLTAHGSVDSAVESMRLGAFDYIKKPFELSVLAAAVEKAVEKKRAGDIARAAFCASGRDALKGIILESASRMLEADETLLVLADSGSGASLEASLGVEEENKTARLGLGARGLALLEAAGGDVLALAPGSDRRFQDLPGAGEVPAALFIPLAGNDNLAGALCVIRRKGRTGFGEAELRKAKNFGPLVSLALKNSSLTEQLRAARIQLVQTQKMEALGLLTGQISHDFNNLLSVIIGGMQLLREKLDPGSGLHLSEEILRMARDAEGLIRQLMLFSRRNKYPPEAIDLNAATEEIKLIIEKLPGKGIRTVYRTAADLPLVKIRPEHFKQVAINLAINARNAVPEGGEVVICTRRTAAGVVFEVSDNGPGISQENLKNIFEPFFTTKPVGKGTGLGLSIVRSIVGEYGGEVAVESCPGQGASFRVFLPAA